MKTILICTNFSKVAKQAAEYGLRLAGELRLKLLLAHALPVPVPMVTPAGIDIPYGGSEEDREAILERLAIERDKLSNGKFTRQASGMGLPELEIAAGFGSPGSYLGELVKKQGVGLVIVGLSGRGNTSRFLLGSTSRDLIKMGTFPVLLLPKDISYKPVKQIIFASELQEGDFHALGYLAEIAGRTKASIRIAHVLKGGEACESERIEHFLVRAKAMLPGLDITSLNIYNHSEMDGLDWLQKHTSMDCLAMVHREHSFFSNLFHQPFSQQMARIAKGPLLIIPEDYPLSA